MLTKQLRGKIYNGILDQLEKKRLSRNELINNAYKLASLDQKEMSENGTDSKKQLIRCCVGEALTTMEGNGIIKQDENGEYKLLAEKPIAIRIEKCEKEILSMLSKRSHTRNEIKNHLISLFGTEKTYSKKDDTTLFQYISQILKRLRDEKSITVSGESISLCPDVSARIDDIQEMLELKNVFLVKLHSKGGEFFEHYFVELISKYLAKNGKKIVSAAVTAGSDDGGIDGIVKTEDCLGFRETIMIQTKNRLIITNETDVRGFYGAVCAKKGTRGIYAITSKFHHNARKFLDSLDDCIGIDGDDVFDMAVKCKHGITRSKEKYVIDNKIFD